MTRVVVRNPSQVRKLEELLEIIASIEQFEKETGQIAAVVKQQNRSLGSAYFVMPATEAQSHFGKWMGAERYSKIWTKESLYHLRENYNSDTQVN